MTKQNLPVLNADLLTQLVKWAGQDIADLNDFFANLGWPTWDQSHWAQEIRNGVCETACCIAGNAVVQSDEYMIQYRPWSYDELDDGRSIFEAEGAVEKVPDGVDDKGNVKFKPKARAVVEPISTVASRLIGITEAEADTLFNGENHVGDIALIAMAIGQRRGITLDIPVELLSAQRNRYDNDLGPDDLLVPPYLPNTNSWGFYDLGSYDDERLTQPS